MATAKLDSRNETKGQLFEPLRQALPISYDAFEAFFRTVFAVPMRQDAPANKEERDIVQKRQAIALGIVIVLGAAIRKTAWIGEDTVDALLFAIGVVVYAGLAALVLKWVIGLLATGKTDNFSTFGVGIMLSSVTGTLLIATLAYLAMRQVVRASLLVPLGGPGPQGQIPLSIAAGGCVCLVVALFGSSKNVAGIPDKIIVAFLLAIVATIYVSLLSVRFALT